MYEKKVTLRKHVYEKAGQGHVFKAWDQLNEQEKFSLMEQTDQFDVEQVNNLFDSLVKNYEPSSNEENTTFEPADKSICESKINMVQDQRDKLYELGMQKIREGKAAVIVMAGGQGTRLGFSHPKGMYQIGLPSEKSIFQVLVERFFKVQMLANNVNNITQDGKIPQEAIKCKMLLMTTLENY